MLPNYPGMVFGCSQVILVDFGKLDFPSCFQYQNFLSDFTTKNQIMSIFFLHPKNSVFGTIRLPFLKKFVAITRKNYLKLSEFLCSEKVYSCGGASTKSFYQNSDPNLRHELFFCKSATTLKR